MIAVDAKSNISILCLVLLEFLLFGLEPHNVQKRIAVQIWEPSATRMQTKIKF